MTAFGTAAAATPELLPWQRLAVGDWCVHEGVIHLRLRLRPESADRVRRAANQLRQLDKALFLIPERVDEEGEYLLLSYPKEAAGTIDAAAVFDDWRRDPPVVVPMHVQLSQLLVQAFSKLAQTRLPFLPLSPGHLRFTPQRPDPWRLLAIPAVDTPSENDSALAAPATLAWTPPEALRGDFSRSAPYVLGSVLYLGLIGSPVSSYAPTETYERLLRGQGPSLARLETAITFGLPPDLGEASRGLYRFIAETLEPAPERRMSWDEVTRTLLQLSNALSVRRVALRWEHGRQLDVSRRIIEKFAEAAPGSQVPWEALSRLRENAGDIQGAVNAALEGLSEDPGETLRPYLRFMRRMAKRVPVDVKLLQKSIGRIKVLVPEEVLDETSRLHVANLLAQHVGVDAAMPLVETRCELPWNEAMRLVILARLLTEKSEYVQVSQLCRAVRQFLASQPDRGGPAGRYADAYVLLLDGIVNYGAIGFFGSPSFLNDAFQQLVASLSVSVPFGAKDLKESAMAWMAFISHFCSGFDQPPFTTTRLGIEAYLAVMGWQSRTSRTTGSPAIPWYDDEILFPL